MAPALEMIDVAKSYGGTAAVAGVSLEVAAGEVVGLLGPNGAGKSTALRMIAGLVRPDAGRIGIGGHDLATERARALASAGFLIEGPALPSELTARRSLLYLARLDGAVAPGRADELLAEVGLAEAADKRVKHLSLGMKQRLALAAALWGRPRLLVLDEPMNGLDPGGVRQMGELLRRLAGEGVGLLVSSHLLEQVERTADTVVVMWKGKVVARERVAGGDSGALARRFFALTGEAAGDDDPIARQAP